MNFSRVHDRMTAGVESGVFPGAVLLVFQWDRIQFFNSYGFSDGFAGIPAKPETVYDLASLTKPLATTLALMSLAKTGQLDPDRPIAQVADPIGNLPLWGVATPAQLLTHCGGLRSHFPYYAFLPFSPGPGSRRELREFLNQEPLQYPPGKDCVYSDIGFMILDWVVERISGVQLDDYLREHMYDPLKADLFFNRLGNPIRPAPYAATELCPRRKILLKGHVHDDNAWAAGGVSGHAGLFGSAMDVFRVLKQLLLDLCGLSEKPFFDRTILSQWLVRSGIGKRAYGFDMPGTGYTSCGRYFSNRSIGHLGFTGTSFWVDPETGVGVILLSNRVHPSRFSAHRPPLIRAFRPLLHNEIMKEMGFETAYRPELGL